MSALIRIDARHVARSPLLLGGVAFGLVVAGLELFSASTLLPLADVLLYRNGGLALGCGALLAGAWLGLRDEASGTAECLAATPTPVWRRERARLAAAVLAAAAVFALVIVLGTGAAALAGTRGVPDARLALDGMLAVGLGAGMGLLIGRVTHSRVASLFAGAAWFLMAAAPAVFGLDTRRPARLLPVVFFEERSAVLGFLPDPFWGHLAYSAGLLVVLAVAVVLVAGRGEEPRVPPLPLAAAGLAGAAAVAVSATWLWALPDALAARGPAPADWTAVALDEYGTRLDTERYSYPADGLATACARGPDVEVCVYPAYGEALARRVVADTQPLAALLAGLPDVPERIRMVPSSTAPCQGAEVQLPESDTGVGVSGIGPHNLLGCALLSQDGPSHPGMSAATAAVYDWAMATVDPGFRAILQDARAVAVEDGSRSEPAEAEASGTGAGPSRTASFEVTLALLALPTQQVLAELEPIWERLRAGEVDLDELPGAAP